MSWRNGLLNFYWRWRYRGHADREQFDPRWYRQCYQDVRLAGADPWVHYVRFGKAEGRAPCPAAQSTFEGAQPFREEKPLWCVVGHQAGPRLYGAERSLVDVLRLLNMLDINVMVVLPSAINRRYIDQLREHCWCVKVMSYGWWYQGRQPVLETQRQFLELVNRYRPQVLYANTLTLEEPLLAAREAGIPVVVHVREVLAEDAELQKTLNADEVDAHKHLRERADVVVANSRFTAQSLGLETVTVVPNPVDVTAFHHLPAPCLGGELVVGMLSSNLPKKGLGDFIEVANLVYRENPQVLFQLVGPENSHTDALKRRQADGEVSPQVVFAGYRESADQALGGIDVVLNLSSFQESFGRTVVEAMAAGRAVVAYDRGAVSDLIDHECNGYLVPFGDCGAVADILLMLATTPGQVSVLGEKARLKAEKHYAFEAVVKAMARVVDDVNGLTTGFDRSSH